MNHNKELLAKIAVDLMFVYRAKGMESGFILWNDTMEFAQEVAKRYAEEMEKNNGQLNEIDFISLELTDNDYTNLFIQKNGEVPVNGSVYPDFHNQEAVYLDQKWVKTK